MEKDNINELRNINLIVAVERIFFDTKVEKTLREKLGAADFAVAQENSNAVFVYRIVYRSNKKKVIGFVVEPKQEDKLPCIIYNRGGSRDFGAIKLGQLFGSIAEFAKRGYIVIASNYAGGPGSEGTDDFGGDKTLVDVLNLYKILKDYKRADIKRIGMYGWSRGALMTYRCLAQVRWLKAVVVGAGPTDEVNAPRFRKGWREHQINMYGGSRVEQIKRSALYWMEKFPKKTPLLIMHGTADWRVNPLDSIQLVEKLYKQKVPFRLVMFEGGDHSISEYKKERDELAYTWFERFVKNKEHLPNLKPHGK